MNATVVLVSQYQNTILQCSAVGIPPPQFMWMRDRGNQNETLTSSATITITDSTHDNNYLLSDNEELVSIVNSTLKIKPVLDEDSGFYFCLARSSGGSESKVISLIVQGEILII